MNFPNNNTHFKDLFLTTKARLVMERLISREAFSLEPSRALREATRGKKPNTRDGNATLLCSPHVREFNISLRKRCQNSPKAQCQMPAPQKQHIGTQPEGGRSHPLYTLLLLPSPLYSRAVWRNPPTPVLCGASSPSCPG